MRWTGISIPFKKPCVPLIHEVRAVLAEAGPETLVFLAADDGHNRFRAWPGRLYRRRRRRWLPLGYVTKRVEGQYAAHVSRSPSRTLGHTRQVVRFPSPAFTFAERVTLPAARVQATVMAA